MMQSIRWFLGMNWHVFMVLCVTDHLWSWFERLAHNASPWHTGPPNMYACNGFTQDTLTPSVNSACAEVIFVISMCIWCFYNFLFSLTHPSDKVIFSFTFVQYKTKSELLICKPKPSITHSDTSGKTTSVCSFSVAINDIVPTVHGTLGHSGFPAADDIPLSATGFHYGPLNSWLRAFSPMTAAVINLPLVAFIRGSCGNGGGSLV